MAKQSDAQQKASEQQDKLINLQAQQLAAQVANWAAQLDFQKERMRLLELPEMQGKLQVDIDRLAFEKAQQTWENAFKEASLTGTYNGQPTTEWLTQQAQLTGVLDGKQTLQGKLTDAQIAQMNEQMRLANQEFLANTTGYINGQPTFDREKFQAGQASDAWKFLATLTGPANAFKQARAIASMPGGMSDLMDQWAGKYAAPGFTSVGSGGRASLAGLTMGAGGNYQFDPGTTGPGPTPVYTPPPAGGWGSPAAPIYASAPTSAYTGGAQPAQGTIPGSAPGSGGGVLDENSPEYRDIQNRLYTGQITRQGAANEWAQLTHTTPPNYGDPDSPGYQPPPGAPGDVVSPTPVSPGPGPIEPPVRAPEPGAPLDENSSQYQKIQQMIAAGTITPEEGAQQWAAILAGQTPGQAPIRTNPVEPLDPVNRATISGAGTPESGWYGSSSTAASGFQAQPYSFQPAGVQAPVHQWNYSPTLTGSMQVYPPGVASPYDTPDISTPHAVSPSTASNYYQYGGVAKQNAAPGTYSGPLLPNQINAKNYGKSYQYQKDLGWAQYEDQGWDKGLAQEAFEKSLPNFSGPKVGSFAF